ncbi:putative signal transduction histidine kinase [Kineococcus radiotolerans SRS30216 = ATCC BAA-149]|uniref:Signal transduction histidine kinase n=1 Tax=Kineococcus radiotolerans (strain ATCC BAA-149 / DSM 14245 / SRS30216) TaxID=266940 RepID=A6W4A8_KINRD|nr:putative signal transduction histidine kinase [Kineococcus radiotolerans SRS30216 = ATCC BAA-149]
MGPVFRVVLPPNPRSVGVARWLITEWCAPWVAAAQLDEDVVESALLLASEVITNAVVHGDGMVQVDVGRVEGPSLRVEVSDDGGGMPLIGAQRTDAESGRGMAMVELLSSRWGTDLAVGPLGKTVWFEVSGS